MYIFYTNEFFHKKKLLEQSRSNSLSNKDLYPMCNNIAESL